MSIREIERTLAGVGLALAACVSACGGDDPGTRPAGARGPGKAPTATVEVQPGEGGTVSIRGSTRFVGEPPARRPLAITGVSGCQHDGPAPLTESVIVKDGRLGNCIVFVSRGLPQDGVPPAPTEPVFLDQHGCVYRPHVSALRVGQELRVKNSDPTSHNVRVEARRTSVPNRTQAAGGADLRIVFEAPEPPVKFGCDIHPWMGAWVGVFDHPYFAVTGPEGEFLIEGLPPGRYTLTSWHESFERGTVDVDLSAGGGATVEFVYGAP